MITVKSLSKSYGEKQVLNQLNLTIKPQQLTLLLGANGAGKSTFLNLIGNLVAADEGDIFYNKVSLKHIPRNEFAKQCAILKQSNFIQLKLTVNELVAFGRYPYSKGRLTQSDHQVIDEVIQWCGCEAFRFQSIHALSGGQRQRALLAMILAQDSDVILLDEPISNLDLKQSVTMMKLLKEVVQKRQKTVVMIVHDINIAATYGDEIILMKDGQCLYQGSVDEVIQPSPLSECYDVDFIVETLNDRKISYIK